MKWTVEMDRPQLVELIRAELGSTESWKLISLAASRLMERVAMKRRTSQRWFVSVSRRGRYE